MKQLTQRELNYVSGGEGDVLFLKSINEENFNTSPFMTGFFDGANYSIYAVGLTVGAIAAPVVVAGRVVKSIASTAYSSASYIAHSVYNPRANNAD